ncbi:hypothetical protein Q9Q99_10595 [Curtobacterium flaccumfaciens]|nr:hypothetical protein Q9Q99_10595 [Curtobacterium flaccumfaciens]
MPATEIAVSEIDVIGTVRGEARVDGLQHPRGVSNGLVVGSAASEYQRSDPRHGDRPHESATGGSCSGVPGTLVDHGLPPKRIVEHIDASC